MRAERQVITVQQNHDSIRQPTDTLPPLFSVLRPHQWLKNLLIVVPVLAAHRLDWTTGSNAILAFISFSLCASGGYVLNDLLDVDADRQHPRKSSRAIASGRLSVKKAIVLIILAWSAAFGIAAMTLPGAFTAILAVYVAGTASYSIRLKQEPALDVVLLACLYVWRVVAGGVATAIPVSTWLLAFTLFVCVSLALMKRFIEVHAQAATAVAAPVPRRGYRAEDAQWLHSGGLAAAYLSVVILAIYANNPAVTLLYANPDRLLLMCPILLYWSTRTWLRVHRREGHDDPVLLVARDPMTYVLMGLCVMIVAAAI